MHRFVWVAPFVVAGCATEVVELARMDASVDAGPLEVVRDGGPEPEAATLSCPDSLVAAETDELFDVLPDTPFSVAATSELVMTAYGGPYLDMRGFGYALRFHDRGGEFGTGTLQGTHRWGPRLVNDADRGFVVVHRVDVGVVGELLQVDTYRLGERSTRDFAPWSAGPVWDVAYVDDTLLVAIADAARPRLARITRTGRPVGFGERELPTGIVEARLEWSAGVTWLFVRTAATPDVVVAHRLDDDGTITASTPFDACAPLHAWDALTTGDDAAVAMTCDDGAFLMSTRSTQKRRITADSIAVAPRIASDGEVVAAAYWLAGAPFPHVRFASLDLTAIATPVEAPVPEVDDDPAALDLVALPGASGWWLGAASRKGDGWLTLFDGCALESR